MGISQVRALRRGSCCPPLWRQGGRWVEGSLPLSLAEHTPSSCNAWQGLGHQAPALWEVVPESGSVMGLAAQLQKRVLHSLRPLMSTTVAAGYVEGLIRVNQNGKCGSSVTLATLQAPGSHRLVAAASSKADVSVSVILGSSVDSAALDGSWTSPGGTNQQQDVFSS